MKNQVKNHPTTHTHTHARMREIQRRWKVGAYNYEGRRRRTTVWHVMVGGERELAN